METRMLIISETMNAMVESSKVVLEVATDLIAKLSALEMTLFTAELTEAETWPIFAEFRKGMADSLAKLDDDPELVNKVVTLADALAGLCTPANHFEVHEILGGFMLEEPHGVLAPKKDDTAEEGVSVLASDETLDGVIDFLGDENKMASILSMMMGMSE